jgi:hypothetical protein
MPTQLAIYLRNHEAAARAGYDLFRRASANQRRRPYGAELAELAGEVAEDLSSLQLVLRANGVQPDLVLGTALRIGERVGRLKPNGRILTRAPLSDLIEVEGLLNAVHAKGSGWQALAAAGPTVHDGGQDFDQLFKRAENQRDRLARLHATVAARVLSG